MAAYTAIDDPSAYFKVQLYTGDGSVQAIAFDDTDTDMQPDAVWIKNRDTTDTHLIFDSVRGATNYVTPSEHPNPTEVTDDDTLTAFGSDGFTVGDDDKVNTNTEKYVAWCWKESATAGFDIVSYSGNSTNRTIAHSLSAIPHFYFVIARGDDNRADTYHHRNTDAPETDNLIITYSDATNDNDAIWNDTAPTSSVFGLGTGNEVNDTGNTYIAYLWSEKQGFSKFGSYEGNGNADGTFVYTGFRPAFIMTKSIDSTSSWHMFDNKREGYNVDNDPLAAEVETAEATTDMIDILSNGFKFRIATDPNVAETYIYIAFAEAPFVNSNGVPCNAR